MLEIRIGGLRGETHPAENPRYRSRVLLLHGLWAGAWCWRHFGSFLAHRGWEAVAADLRGRPGSGEGRPGRLTVEDHVADVVGLLRSEVLGENAAEGRAAPVVIGHDLGGLVALLAAREARCAAIVALAPPFPEAITAEYRRWLTRSAGWLRREVPPPTEIDGEPAGEMRGFQREPVRVARSVLRGWPSTEPAPVPTLVVGGTRDRLLDLERLRGAAVARGCEFAEREAGHWGLWTGGFERQVDPVHRWLVRVTGEGLLRLTGAEDLEDEEDGPSA